MDKKELEGTITSIEEIKKLSQGAGKKGPWTLWGTNIEVDGDLYSATSFSHDKLAEEISSLSVGDRIKSDVWVNEKGYWCIEFEKIEITGHTEVEQKPQEQKKLEPEMPQNTYNDIAEEAVVMASVIIGKLNLSVEETVKTRLELVKEMLIDRREKFRQSYKEKNIKDFRR